MSHPESEGLQSRQNSELFRVIDGKAVCVATFTAAADAATRRDLATTIALLSVPGSLAVPPQALAEAENLTARAFATAYKFADERDTELLKLAQHVLAECRNFALTVQGNPELRLRAARRLIGSLSPRVPQ